MGHLDPEGGVGVRLVMVDHPSPVLIDGCRGAREGLLLPQVRLADDHIAKPRNHGDAEIRLLRS